MLPRDSRDPLENEIELAFRPGTFISDGACFSFVSDLEAVAARIEETTRTDPVRATQLYGAFLAGCYAKSEELDDSSGGFGRFAVELICGWIKTRQASGANPHQTATRLLSWIDDDPYGFCSQLEEDAAKVLDPDGMTAFEQEIKARFESSEPALRSDRRWGMALRTLYRAQQNTEAYIGIAEQTGLNVMDCQAIANLLAAQDRPDEALLWIERGIERGRTSPRESMASYELAGLRRELLVRVGRGDDALTEAWDEYQAFPDKYRYDELMKFVPAAERAGWHEKAIDAAQGAEPESLLDLLVETGETHRLAAAVRAATDAELEHMSHYVTEPAALALETSYPDLAATLWRAQGLRIVNRKKSKYYDAAVSNFERAHRCYQRAGLDAQWQQLVLEVRTCHRRKMAFMVGFENVVAGVARVEQKSFLELAKARWNKGDA